jgi:hypothetical protein
MAIEELWKKIPGHKGYEASNVGRIRSIDRWITYKTGQRVFYKGKMLSQFKSGGRRPTNGFYAKGYYDGYRTVHLGQANMQKYVHHLIALTFMGKTPKGMEICHNNGIKSDNRLENLRFDTRQNNVYDTMKHRYEQAWLEYASHPEKSTRSRRMGRRSHR